MMYFQTALWEDHLDHALQSCLAACQSVNYKLTVVSSQPLQETVENAMLRYKEVNEYPWGLDDVFKNKTGRDLLDLVQFESSIDSVKKNRFAKLALVMVRFGEADYQVRKFMELTYIGGYVCF